MRRIGSLFFLNLSLVWHCFVFAADPKPLVIFFGGCGFDQAAKEAWEKASKQKNPSYDYNAVVFPKLPKRVRCNQPENIAAAGASEVQAAMAEIRKYAAIVPRKKIFIASHSSGSAIADAVMKAAANEALLDDGYVSFSFLDGFRPSQVYLRSPENKRFTDVTCWTTSYIVTVNWQYMTDTDACAGGTQKFTATDHCKSLASLKSRQWCAHMSLVYKGLKYGDGEVNLDWLPKLDVNSQNRQQQSVKLEK